MQVKCLILAYTVYFYFLNSQYDLAPKNFFFNLADDFFFICLALYESDFTKTYLSSYMNFQIFQF